MRGARVDRLWVVGGAVGAVLLLAIGWFFFIGPQQAQTDALNEKAAAAQVQLAAQRRRLAELRKDNTMLPQYRAQLALDQQALPTTSGLSDFLRQLQAGGDRTGVSVSGVTVAAPLEVTAASRHLYALPVTLTATGTFAELSDFLDQLQRVQPRVLLIDNATAAPGVGSLTLAGAVSLTFGVRVFVASTDNHETAPPAPKTK
jgi:Tfp pilus assembly protein PilO